MKNKRSKEWLSKEEYYQIVNYPYISRRDELIISLLYFCALRIGELEELRVRDIDIDKGTLTMWEYKNSEDPALIPIPVPLIKMLSQWITENKLSPLKYIFSSNRSKKISRTQYFRIVKDCANAAGINKEISSHTFRSYAANRIMPRDYSPYPILFSIML